MSDEPENLVLVYLRRIDANVQELRSDVAEMKHRQNDMARQLAALRREQASDAEDNAHLHARLDLMKDEIGRIKRRLDIID